MNSDKPIERFLQVKAGILGRGVSELNGVGTVVDGLARSSGVTRVANGFRCPDGSFTDARGTTCIRVVPRALGQEAVDAINAMANVRSSKAIAADASNSRIEGALKEVGASFPNPSPSFISRDNDLLPIESRHIFRPMTRAESIKRRDGIAGWHLDKYRNALVSGDTSNPLLGNLHPEVRDLIVSKSNEEIMEILKMEAVRFHQGIDRRVRVNIPARRFSDFLEDGTYRTTHEVQSDHSGADIRREYEASIGIPMDAPASVRPASGWITHPDIEEAARQQAASKRELTDFTEIEGLNGPVESYGPITMTLGEAASGRSAYGFGDTLKEGVVPARLDETDPEAIASAVLSPGVFGGSRMQDTILALLESRRTGSFRDVNAASGESRMYMEALIPGAFNIDDVESVSADYEFLAGSREPQKQVVARLMDEFFSPEALVRFGLAPEDARLVSENAQEIMAKYEKIYKNSSVSYSLMFDPKVARSLAQLESFRSASKKKQRLNDLGIEVKVTHVKQIDPFNPESYGGSLGDDIESILKGRVIDAMPRILEDLKKAPSDQANDFGDELG